MKTKHLFIAIFFIALSALAIKLSNNSYASASMDSKPQTQRVKLSANNDNLVVGDTVTLKVTPDGSQITGPFYINIGSQIDLVSVQDTSDNQSTKVEVQKNQQTNRLKISNSQPITTPFTITLKVNAAGQTSLTADADDKHITSNTLVFKTTTNKMPKVLANDPYAFDDGINDWQQLDTAIESSISLNKAVRLAFTFGQYGGGSDMTWGNGNPNPQNRRPIVYLMDNDSYISAFFTDTESTSGTSNSYGIVTDKSSDVSDKGDKGLEDETYDRNRGDATVHPTLYAGHDTAGNLALKKVVTDPAAGYLYEILYRFTPNSPVIQQELYFKNNSDKVLNYGAYFSADTQLHNNDAIALYAMGSNAGIYMADDNYKLLMNMKVPDGPTGYTAHSWQGTVFSGFVPTNITGKGLENENLPDGTQVLDREDSAYTARWNYHALAPGGIDHYRTDIAVTKAPFVVPNAIKTYSNETSHDGQNREGDTLDFSLKAHNIGYKSLWKDISITDKIPEGLDIDPNTLELIDSQGGKTALPASDYNPTTRQLTVKAPDLQDNQWDTITFKAQVASSASGKTLTNTMLARGTDANNPDNPNQSATSSVKIPVVVSPYIASLTKQVKNESNQDQEFKNSTRARLGDTVDYRINYQVNPSSQESFTAGTLKDTLPAGLTLLDGSIQITYSDGTQTTAANLDAIDIKALKQSQSVSVDFKAKVTQRDLAKIDNTATLSGIRSSGSAVNATSNTAELNLYADPTMTKQVKLASDKDSDYTDKLAVGPDSDLDYRVQIKPNKDVKDPELNEIKLSDPFDNKLNQGLTLKEVTANYYDADNKIINNQTEVLTPDSHQVVVLSHPVVPGGHVDVVYQVHLDKAVTVGTVFNNIAYMESSSYGKNADHQLPNWQTNNAQVTAANPDGTVNFKYVDLDTGKEIDGHDPVQVTGKVGHKVSEYTKDQLAPAYIDSYTVIKEQIDDQAIQQATKEDPVIAQKPQTYTYYYEKAALSMEAPKNWNFGKYNTSQTEATYYLPARKDANGKTKPYTVDVHDAYGVKDWTLKVQQKHQFTGINPNTKKAITLSGAQLNFAHLNAQKTSDDGQDTHPQGDQLDLLSGNEFKLPVGSDTPTDLMSYHNAGTYVTANDQNPTGTKYDSPGVKSFAYQFGDATNAGYSIGLHVPASTKREATDYTTTLTWSLSVAP